MKKFLTAALLLMVTMGAGCTQTNETLPAVRTSKPGIEGDAFATTTAPAPKAAAVPAPATTPAPKAVAPVQPVQNTAPVAPAQAPAPTTAPAPVPVITPSPAPTNSITSPSQQYCYKICSKGKACGDSCISRSYTCHKPPGCACDAE